MPSATPSKKNKKSPAKHSIQTYVLQITQNNAAEEHIQLTKIPTLLIGSNPTCDLVLEEETVCDYHCAITRYHDEMRIRAIEGEVHTEKQTITPSEERSLKLNETITIGQINMMVVLSDNTRKIYRRTLASYLFGMARFCKLPVTVALLAIPVLGFCYHSTSSYLNAAKQTVNESQDAKINTTTFQNTPLPIHHSLPMAVKEIFRLSGVVVTTRVIAEGVVEVQGHFNDQDRLTQIAHSRSIREIAGLNKIAVINTNSPRLSVKTSQSANRKKITKAVNGDDPYLITADNSRYYLGAALPDGSRLIRIDGNEVVIETQAGEQRITSPDSIVIHHPENGIHQTAPQTSDFDRFDRIILHAARLYDLEYSLIKAVIQAESHFDPQAISHAGAQGLMQLMPETAIRLHVDDPFHPEQNILGGSKLLRILMNKYHQNIDFALAAYNAGEGAVNKYQGVPPFRETQNYIRKVKRLIATYKNG